MVGVGVLVMVGCGLGVAGGEWRVASGVGVAAFVLVGCGDADGETACIELVETAVSVGVTSVWQAANSSRAVMRMCFNCMDGILVGNGRCDEKQQADLTIH